MTMNESNHSISDSIQSHWRLLCISTDFENDVLYEYCLFIYHSYWYLMPYVWMVFVPYSFFPGFSNYPTRRKKNTSTVSFLWTVCRLFEIKYWKINTNKFWLWHHILYNHKGVKKKNIIKNWNFSKYYARSTVNI